MFQQLVLQLATLAGFAALVSVLVNVGKFLGIVQDGTADKWVAGANLVGIIGLFILRTYFPGVPVEGVDKTMLEIAEFGGYVMGFVVMIFGSKLTYKAVSGLPIVGKSFSGDK